MKKDELAKGDSGLLTNLNTLEEYETLLESGAIPGSLDTPQKLMTVVQTGKELGLAPMVSLNNINVIKGRTVISSAMLGALLKARNIEYDFTKNYEEDEDGRVVTEITFLHISKVTKQPRELKFSISWGEMEAAGYTSKDNWAKYPKNMLRARCMAYGVRALFPEVLLGYYTDLEMNDSLDKDNDVTINEEGDVVILDND